MVKTSEKKRSLWLYIVLVLMVFALIGFSLVPLVTTIISNNQSREATASASVAGIPSAVQNKLETELQGYTLVLEREPSNETALQGLLETQLKLGKLNDATVSLEKLANFHPEELDYQILLAQAKQQINDYEGSAQVYRQILASYPGDMKALTGLVNLLLVQERSEAAIGLLEDTLKIAQEANVEKTDTIDVISVQLLLGQIYAEQKLYQQAIAIYDRGIIYAPEDFRPLLAKALILQEQGKNSEAEPIFQTALELAPEKYQDQIKKLGFEL